MYRNYSYRFNFIFFWWKLKINFFFIPSVSRNPQNLLPTNPKIARANFLRKKRRLVERRR